MRKLLLIPWMLLTMLAVASACGETGPVPDEPELIRPGDNGNTDNVEGGGVNGRCMVLYCSRSGNTERMARTIQSVLAAT